MNSAGTDFKKGRSAHGETYRIVNPQDAPLPTLDSTRLLAKAALRKALEEDLK
ncbi:MAG: hypothetical protein R6X07_05445 [Desulfatiglandales bacterium]